MANLFIRKPASKVFALEIPTGFGSQFLTVLRPTTNDENLDAARRVESKNAASRVTGAALRVNIRRRDDRMDGIFRREVSSATGGCRIV